jgi:hypothetical protein
MGARGQMSGGGVVVSKLFLLRLRVVVIPSSKRSYGGGVGSFCSGIAFLPKGRSRAIGLKFQSVS